MGERERKIKEGVTKGTKRKETARRKKVNSGRGGPRHCLPEASQGKKGGKG